VIKALIQKILKTIYEDLPCSGVVVWPRAARLPMLARMFDASASALVVSGAKLGFSVAVRLPIGWAGFADASMSPPVPGDVLLSCSFEECVSRLVGVVFITGTGSSVTRVLDAVAMTFAAVSWDVEVVVVFVGLVEIFGVVSRSARGVGVGFSDGVAGSGAAVVLSGGHNKAFWSTI